LPPNAESKELSELIDKYSIDTTLLSKEELEAMERLGRTPKSFEKEIIEMAKELLHQSMPGANEHPKYQFMRDHADTLWWAALHADELVWPEYSVVLADEIQDFNKNQVTMLRKLGEAGARIVAVGDPNQAIYRFTGADAKAFNNITNTLNNLPNGVTEKKLLINYRSGSDIIDDINKNTKVKNLVAGKTHKGVVSTNKSYDQMIDKLKDEWDSKGKLQHQTAIISRTNIPLVNTALQLLKNNINFTLLGRDFSKELVEFMDQITDNSVLSIPNFRQRMNQELKSKKETWKNKPSKQKDLKELEETADAFNNVLEYLESNNWKDPKTGIEVRNTKDLKYLFRQLFAGTEEDEGLNTKNSVILSSAHRSKGLEFDRVYVRCPDKFLKPRNPHPEEMEQEENVHFVGRSRASHQLHIVDEKCAG
jgi:superfamily I DNA/RNA helicase